MQFWDNPLVATTLCVLGLLVVAEAVRTQVGPLRRLGVPASILAGTLGLAIGPSGLDVLPLDVATLEMAVYHALAIVFIAVSLQTPRGPQTGAAASAMGVGIAIMVTAQTAVGVAVTVGLGAFGRPTHPGLGLLLPLGFEQGPGQALSLGQAWEASGLVDGGRLGLIMAALGFAWSIGAGIPPAAWGRKRGLQTTVTRVHDAAASAHAGAALAGPGAIEQLTRQLGAIALVYAATWALCRVLADALASMPELAAMVWGFHFMLGATLALGARHLLARAGGARLLDDELLGRIATVTVDLATCGALAAVTLSVLSANWVPLLLVAGLGGAATLGGCLWLAPRLFPDAPFEHCVVWFGMSTGTMPTGLALLRIVDPELKSPAPLSAVLGSAIATPLVAPILLGIHPLAVTAGTDDPLRAAAAAGLCLAWITVIGFGAWKLGRLVPARAWANRPVS